MTKTKSKSYRVEIGPPYCRCIQVPGEIDAHALMWLCAKKEEFVLVTFTGPQGTKQNLPLR